MSSPTVFVVTASHNHRESTRGFCESLICQSYRNFVLVLVDDGSDDGTREMVSSFPLQKKSARAMEVCGGLAGFERA